jgi:nitroreductase
MTGISIRQSQPEPVLSQDEVGILVSSAMTAPSMHNTQPWRFEIFGPVVDVILDQDRTLPAEDPDGRFNRIGLGAAAFNLRVAASMLGYRTNFAIDPDPARREIVARVFLGERQTTIPPLGSLYGELRRRHTYPGPMMTAELPPRVRDLVTEAARAEGADLHWLDAGERDKVGRILHEADELDGLDEDHLTERGRWIGGDRTSEGVPEAVLGPLPAKPAAFRNLSAGFDDPGRSAAVFEQTPVIAILTTPADGPSDWLRAGMGLQHALLTAASYDMAASFLNQALEYAQLRLPVQELVGHAVRPQLIIRIGYPAEEGCVAPHRPWQQAVTDWH